jgi:hypothetical protein
MGVRFHAACFGSLPEALRSLAAWLLEQQVEEGVMEWTAQYWKPVWGTLERHSSAPQGRAKNTKQKKNLKSELHGEIPPRISSVDAPSFSVTWNAEA